MPKTKTNSDNKSTSIEPITKNKEAEINDSSKEMPFHSRDHAEFHNAYTLASVTKGLQFLKVVYGEKLKLSEADIDQKMIDQLKIIGKDIYFFISSLTVGTTPEIYIKRKYEFIRSLSNYKSIGSNNKEMFYLAWNGLITNDSFKRLIRQKFGLEQFWNDLCPQNIPSRGTELTRYRTKFVLAMDMASNEDKTRRVEGRQLDDGSGLIMKERIIWLPNSKAMPLYPNAYVPLNQTQVILVRHGKSIHESGGSNPEFVGSGYWDSWRNNRRVSYSVGNSLKEEGIETAKSLGLDFKVAVDTLQNEGFRFWAYSKENPINVFGSESENTEQTSRYFLSGADYTNINFKAIYGLNSQKYGALTHRFKNDVFSEIVKIYGDEWAGSESDKMSTAKKMLKNRFYHYPEGETLIEADWRIGYSFIQLVKANQGKRIMLCDHSGAIRVFEAIIRTLDFADYSSLKEGQDSIMALTYQLGMNIRYDYLQKKEFKLR